MPSTPILRPMRSAILAAGCALPASACITWGTQPAPAPAVRRTLDAPVRVTRRDGYSVVLDPAQVIGDSVFGVSKGEKRRVAVALRDVARMEEQRVNVVATLAIVAVAAATAFGAYVYSIFNDPNY